ncbi:hypothetical protein [Flagellimonas sp.]|uniref:hypothetical protein n=1 Tax=Flagellimonas sp. TaxID=2058762 RepID=UPI003B5936B6
MTKERKLEIKQEAERRLNEWLTHSSFNEMSVHGSKIRFNMSLGLYGGYPFEEPNWMKGKSFNDFVTEKEFDSDEYDNIIDDLFKTAIDR